MGHNKVARKPGKQWPAEIQFGRGLGIPFSKPKAAVAEPIGHSPVHGGPKFKPEDLTKPFVSPAPPALCVSTAKYIHKSSELARTDQQNKEKIIIL